MIVIEGMDRAMDCFTKKLALEDILMQELAVSEGDTALVVEFMYRVLLDMYTVGKARGNTLRATSVIDEIAQRGYELDKFEAHARKEEGDVVIGNWLYLLTPRNDVDYSDSNIGGFAQLRINLKRGWMPGSR